MKFTGFITKFTAVSEKQMDAAIVAQIQKEVVFLMRLIYYFGSLFSSESHLGGFSVTLSQKKCFKYFSGALIVRM